MAAAHRTPGGAHADIANVRAYVRPYSHHHRYHAYYREGLRAAASELGVGFEVTSMTRLPGLLGRLRRFQDRGYHFKVPRAAAAFGRGFDAVGRALEGQVRLPSPSFDPRIGQYLVTLADGSSRRVCIDSMDPPELSNLELAAWSDVTFKTNFWPTVEYPANVRPLVNGDPTVLDRIPALRAARSTPKHYDLCCIMRVWGGREGLEGIEHNIRLLEAVKRAALRRDDARRADRRRPRGVRAKARASRGSRRRRARCRRRRSGA